MFRNIELYRSVISKAQLVYVEEGIAAGFPSPAQDYASPTLDLNEKLIQHPAATLVGRIGFLEYDGIKKDDILIVDRSLTVIDYDLVLCILNGELMIRRVRRCKNVVKLCEESDKGSIIEEFVVVGVIIASIHPKRPLDEMLFPHSYSDLFQDNMDWDLTDTSNLPSLDLNKLLIRNAASTFYSRVGGDSLTNAGVRKGDLVVIDKSLPLNHNDIALCYLDNGFTLKFVSREKDAIWLIPANKKYSPIKITNEEEDFRIWGVVTAIINLWRGRK